MLQKNSIKILILLLFLSTIFSCKQNVEKEKVQGYNIFCSAENFKSKHLLDSTGHFYLNGLQLRTDEYARTGKYSLKFDSTKLYGFSVNNLILKPDQYYELSAWISDTANVFLVYQGKINYRKSQNIVKQDSKGWYKISMVFSIPEMQLAKVYVLNAAKNTVYIDDFRFKEVPKIEFSPDDNPLHIVINKDEFEKIRKLRNEALDKGLLQTEDDSWVKAMMINADDTYKIKMRLKGDWLDHIKTPQWSFRIKIKKGKSFDGMIVFSIQDPATRDFLNEWLMHKVFQDEGIISPKYGFIPVSINDSLNFIYAYEEHFMKQIVESQKRREGPILKFDDGAYWMDILLGKKDVKKGYAVYNAATISPFIESKTIKNPTLYSEFLIAQNLAYQHKNFLTPISDVFDIKKLAKYFALVNVQRLYHGALWINQRFYYNPITSKLEIIAYDLFTEAGVFDLYNRPVFGDFNAKTANIHYPSEKILLYMFADSAFVKNYIFYLKKYSQKSFWDSVFVKYSDQINYNEHLLQRQFKYYKFDKDFFYSNAELVRNHLPQYIEKVDNGLYDNLKISNNLKIKQKQFDYKIAPLLVNSYLEKINEQQYKLTVVNYNPVAINLQLYSSEKGNDTINQEIAAAETKPGIRTFIINQKPENLHFKVPNTSQVFTDDVFNWPKPRKWSPRQELEQQNKFPNESYYKVVDKKVVFSGKQTIDKIVLIPRGYQVIIKPGTVIDLVSGGGILSYSSVFVQGTKQSPVKVSSTDNNSTGFTVLQAPKVEMNYAIFDGLNTFSYKGWLLSGAVTIYESKVKISNCSFINNICEDDLNVVRSHFEVTNTVFANTFSDAFDSDFSNGLVDNCTFDKLGNDAIDFSTSRIEIKNCKITKATDKGVSGGEGSHLKVINCIIDGANIGIASKDLSVVEADNCVIKNTTYALSAFQKKPEYGAAKLIINKLKAENNLQTSLIEKKSLLILDGLNVAGKYKNVAKMFY